jgi:iron complex outermembrane receptor protein
MSRHVMFGGCSSIVLTCFLSVGITAPTVASAQSSESTPVASGNASVPRDSSAARVDEVVVTGSLLRNVTVGALPVQMIGAAELEKQGSPSIVQLVKTIPAAASSIGESNRFLGDVAGSATINLRGFGSARTLVLFNGRRLTASTAAGIAGGEDINFIPTAAIGRIEVLKDGAAATYGSDAVGGVVNFISRTDLKGFEINGNYSYINGSDGDYNIDAAYGWKSDRASILLTAGYRRRSELRTTQRDWALLPNAADPFGGYSSASNPGGYQTGVGGGVLPSGSLAHPFTGVIGFQDDGCTQLGGEIIAGTCRFHYTKFDNLVNNEFHYQTYGEVNYRLTDDINFHLEAFWSRNSVPDERVSPTQSTVNFPSPIQPSGGYTLGGGLSPYPATGVNEQSRFYIPFQNPGLTALYNTHCGAGAATPYSSVQCADIQSSGVITSQTQWRPQGYGGNPLFPDGADHQSRRRDAFRIASGFDGRFANGIDWRVGLTYMSEDAYVSTPDEGVNRVQLALRGLGGPNCNVAANTPGQNGCFWFNPFSNGVAKDAVSGTANPFFNAAAVPGDTNTQELFRWMHEDLNVHLNNRIFVADALLNGEVAQFSLPGGHAKWAVGAQYRYDSAEVSPDDLYNIAAARCVDDVDDPFPHQRCSSGAGSTDFVAAITSYRVHRAVGAVFGELSVPIFNTLNVDGAIRYERYGGNIGGTTNPKVDFKWQALPWIAFRGSVGTTFRAPPQPSVTPGFNRVLTNFTDPTTGASLYRPADTYNNPNLQPETAVTYDAGIIGRFGGLTGTVDYWRFDFKKELTNETAAAVYRTLFPSANPATFQCGNSALVSRFTFVSGAGATINPRTGTNCYPSNFLGIRTNLINGPNVTTDGLDFTADYAFGSLFGGRLNLGGDANYLLSYKRGPLVTLDGITIAPAIDRAGKLDQLSLFYSDPKIKANFYINYAIGIHNVRLGVHYIGEMKDVNHVLADGSLAKEKPYTSVDLIYRVALPYQTVVTLGVTNLFDQDPPFVYSQYNYDYGLGNPLGRVIEFGIKKHF